MRGVCIVRSTGCRRLGRQQHSGESWAARQARPDAGGFAAAAVTSVVLGPGLPAPMSGVTIWARVAGRRAAAHSSVAAAAAAAGSEGWRRCAIELAVGRAWGAEAAVQGGCPSRGSSVLPRAEKWHEFKAGHAGAGPRKHPASRHKLSTTERRVPQNSVCRHLLSDHPRSACPNAPCSAVGPCHPATAATTQPQARPPLHATSGMRAAAAAAARGSPACKSQTAL